jgi:hypothetical protein
VVLVLTMGLAGLWHGANFTFVAWGAVWGLYILVGRLLRLLPFRNRIVSWALNMTVIVVLWVFFRAQDIGGAFDHLGVMFDVGSGVGELSVAIGAAAGVAGLFVLHWVESVASSRFNPMSLRRLNTGLVAGVLVGLIVGLLLIPNGSNNPFIYFRF